jgi:hypothetical protein
VGAFRLESLHSVSAGAASVLLSHGLATVQVDICARDERRSEPSPVAVTDRYELFVANQARGVRSTPRPVIEAVRLLARVIAGNESRAAALPVLTLSERLRRFGGRRLSVKAA